jgi:hypothetical protein
MLPNLVSIETQALIGAALLGLGWLLGRWGERHDVKSWVISAAWRAVFGFVRRRGWRQIGRPDLDALAQSDPTLKRQINDKVEAIKSDTARVGKVRAAMKHGAIYALAQVAGVIAGPLILIGMGLLGVAAWRWLG